tara:strand:+ start:2201 stop:5713 length:3513 start_codon:yes stop_codon:yes gene_type:complete
MKYSDFYNEKDTSVSTTGSSSYADFYDLEEEKEKQQIKADPATEDAKGIEAWAQDQERMNNLSTYMISRFGEEDGIQKKEESNQDYIKRFITHARKIENNSVGLMSQIDYLRGADDDQRIAFGTVYDEYNNLDYFADGTARAVKDTVTQMLFDPINLFSFGIGKLAASTVGKVAVKEGFKRFIPKSAVKRGAIAGAVGGGSFTVLEDIGMQDVERKGFVGDARPEDEIDLFRASTAFGLGAVVGGTAGAIAGKLTREPLSDEAKKLDPRKASKIGAEKNKKKPSLTVEQDKMLAKDAEIEGFDPSKGVTLANATKQVKEFQRKKAKEMREKGVQYTPEGLYKDTPFLEPQLLLALNKKMSKVVYNIAKEDPSILTKYGKNVQISDIVHDTLIRAANEGDEGIAKDVLDRALRKEGISSDDFIDFMEATDGFAKMKKGTASEAGATLAVDSPLGKMRKALLDISPEAKTRIDEIFGNPDEGMSALGFLYSGARRLDRERRALMVTQIATTARNVATGVAVLGFDTASNIMEASLYHTGRAFREAINIAAGRSKFSGQALKRGMDAWFKDSTSLVVLMVNQGKAKEMTDFMLQHNPRLAKILDRTLQEVGEGDGLSGFSRWMNYLNITQDRVFRRAFFAQSIERKLRRAELSDTAENIYRKADGTVDEDRLKLLGLKKDSRIEGLNYLYAMDKELDVDLLKDGIDEALKNTFAFMPKKGPVHHLIKAVEGLPGVPIFGTGEFPFARFMANAMAFQLKYSPLNGIGSTFNYSVKYGMRKAGILGQKAQGKAGRVMSEAENQKFRESFSQSMVGTAALATAIYYRTKNQDTKWYEGKNSEGKTIDLRPFFPLAPYLIVADIAVKISNGEESKLNAKDILEGFTGAQFRAGAASYTVDRFFELIGQEGSITGEQVGETFGTYLGELTGGFLTPLRVVKDIEAAFDEELAILRDTRQIEGEGGTQRAFDSFIKSSFHKNLPNFLGELPVVGELFAQDKDLPEFKSPTREGPVRRQSPLLGQILGLRFVERRTPVETELVRLGYENYEIMPSKGDKLVDSLIKKELGPLVNEYLTDTINSDNYINATENQKQNIIKKRLEKLRKYSTDVAKIKAAMKAEEEDAPFTPFERTEWMRTSKLARRLANEWFLENEGESVDDSKRYREGRKIGLALQRLYQ